MSNELIERLDAATEVDRELDAEIACALHDGGGHDDPRDNTYARNGKVCHGSKPGNYDVHAFSGVSMRTAMKYTATFELKNAAIAALRAQEKDDG